MTCVKEAPWADGDGCAGKRHPLSPLSLCSEWAPRAQNCLSVPCAASDDSSRAFLTRDSGRDGVVDARSALLHQVTRARTPRGSSQRVTQGSSPRQCIVYTFVHERDLVATLSTGTHFTAHCPSGPPSHCKVPAATRDHVGHFDSFQPKWGAGSITPAPLPSATPAPPSQALAPVLTIAGRSWFALPDHHACSRVAALESGYLDQLLRTYTAVCKHHCVLRVKPACCLDCPCPPADDNKVDTCRLPQCDGR